jgi:hypothetical protein
MTPPEWIEIVLFIHGIMPEKEVRSHDSVYNCLFDLIQNALREKNKPQLDPAPIKVEWGWQSDQSTEMDRFLTEAEGKIADQVSAAEKRAHDFSIALPLRPIHLLTRQMITLGFADLFYYVSRDGEKALRQHVFKYLSNEICQRKTIYPESKISLTLITHSAGTIIAHDLLYHLFREKTRKSEGRDEIRRVRALVRKGDLRVRRFYTMGSPITPLIIRANSLLAKIINGDKLDPEDIGLRQRDDLSNPRWVNFWDIDDVAAFPIEFLYANEQGVVQDKYVDLGDIFPQVHGQYWSSSKVAEYIAETF